MSNDAAVVPAVGLSWQKYLFMAIGIFLFVGSILPAGLQQKIACQIAAFERRTGIVALLILSILVYWILRILAFI